MSRDKVKCGGLSRADVAEARQWSGEAAAAFVAGQLGLKPAAPRDLDELHIKTVEVAVEAGKLALAPAREPQEIPPSDRPHPNQARVRFWRLDRRETVKPTPPPKPSMPQPQPDPHVDEPPGESAPYQLLADPAAWMQRLLHALNDQRTTRDLDVPRVVETLGRAEVLRAIPYAQRRALGQHVHVIDDRHLHLTPYWIDHAVFTGELFRRLPEYAASRSVLVAGQSRPQLPLRRDAGDADREWALPPAGSVVVAFTDLGALARQSGSQRRAWRGITRRLLARGCRLIAITPARWRDTDPQLAAQWALLPWDAEPERNRSQAVDRQTAAERVLELLAPTIRIEPGLLRAARLLLARRGEVMDAGVEAVAWQHPALASRHSVAATTTNDFRSQGLEAFKGIDAELRREFLEEVRKWRRLETLVTEQVWFEELIALDAAGLDLGVSFANDLASARNYFQTLNNRLREEDGEAVLDRKTCQWFQRLESRWSGLNTELHSDADKVIHQISQVLAHVTGDPPRLVYDPAQQPRPQGETVTLALYQTGQRIVARPHIEAEIAPSGFSPLGLIEATREKSSGYVRLYWEPGGKKDEGLRARGDSALDPNSEQSQTVLSIPAGAKRLIVRSDHETLHWRPEDKPDWADACGRDRYGLWADWSHNGVTQRFRWIPPGSFWMGSPEHEKGRFDRENQRHVTLTRGFWLAETTVTQALWKAVMPNNRSSFKGDERPVENVSWHDALEMIQILNNNSTSKQEGFMLPTEAQWEYACRSGTRGPFNFVGELTLERVNYRGRWDSNKGEWGAGASQQTAKVTSYPPNAWGLFEMHGNVWEWCRDGWEMVLETAPANDPLTPASGGADRVVRGGSWLNNGRNVRLAFRYHFTRGFRTDNLGFRLARGHQESGAGGAGK